jgi:hypothetical protein
MPAGLSKYSLQRVSKLNYKASFEHNVQVLAGSDDSTHGRDIEPKEHTTHCGNHGKEVDIVDLGKSFEHVGKRCSARACNREGRKSSLSHCTLREVRI